MYKSIHDVEQFDLNCFPSIDKNSSRMYAIIYQLSVTSSPFFWVSLYRIILLVQLSMHNHFFSTKVCCLQTSFIRRRHA